MQHIYWPEYLLLLEQLQMQFPYAAVYALCAISVLLLHCLLSFLAWEMTALNQKFSWIKYDFFIFIGVFYHQNQM